MAWEQEHMLTYTHSSYSFLISAGVVSNILPNLPSFPDAISCFLRNAWSSRLHFMEGLQGDTQTKTNSGEVATSYLRSQPPLPRVHVPAHYHSLDLGTESMITRDHFSC